MFIYINPLGLSCPIVYYYATSGANGFSNCVKFASILFCLTLFFLRCVKIWASQIHLEFLSRCSQMYLIVFMITTRDLLLGHNHSGTVTGMFRIN